MRHERCGSEISPHRSGSRVGGVCDYNYVFDPQVWLRRHFGDEKGDYGFLVDEAHNLVDRAREMFSADLDGREILQTRRAIKSAVPRCARALGKLYSALRRLASPESPVEWSIESSDPAIELNLFPAARNPVVQKSEGGVITRRELPEDVIPIVETALAEAEAWLARNEAAESREGLLEFYFRLRTFQRTAELFDERYVTILERAPALKIRLFCLDPSQLLREALSRGKAAVFFSATLTPPEYYRNLLGGSPGDSVLRLDSPFPPDNLAVLVHDRIRTHFKDRADSLADVVAAIETLIRARRGNYLVYFPSFQYLNAALEAFQMRHTDIAVLAQRPGMTETERDEFLAAFAVEHGETLVGFAVLGGVFGEGIDLVGERLIGSVIVGVGLPQLCIERDLIRDHFQEQSSAGFDYAYTFPGMNRVLQAIGRVIRSETDRGVVLLIDMRFAETRYRRLFSTWWRTVRVRHASTLQAALADFWGSRVVAQAANNHPA